MNTGSGKINLRIRIKRFTAFLIVCVLTAGLVSPVSCFAEINAFQIAHYTNTGLASLYDKMEEKGMKPGEGVVVAVIDTGLWSGAWTETGGSYFDNLWYNEAEKNGLDDVDDDGNGYVDDIYGLNLANSYHEMTDSDGHGTQVSGIIGMNVSENDVKGVAFGARIMPIKVSQDRNYDEDTVIEAIEYAVNNGADIINMSFATYRYSQKLEDAVRKASQSCVMVAAAGNESFVTKGELTSADLSEPDEDEIVCKDAYPAAWDCCIGVMSFGYDDELAYFSNWDQNGEDARKYDIIAPGENIYALTNGGSYKNVKGTSFTTAYVSGAVAIFMGITGKKGDPAGVKDEFLSLMNRSYTYRQAGYVFTFPMLSFSGFEELLTQIDSDDPGTLSGNDPGNGQEQQTDPDDPSSVNENDTDDPASVSANDTDDPSSVSGNGTTGNPEDPSGGQGSGQNPADTNDPVAGVVEKPETGLPGGEEVEQIPQIIENGENGKTEENREPPSIGKINQTKKKLIITIEDLPKDGKVMLKLYKNSRRIYKIKVKDSKVIIKKKKLMAKGKLKVILSWKKDKKEVKDSVKIKCR